jgi:N-acetylglucosamine-6-phosphate deacetylase
VEQGQIAALGPEGSFPIPTQAQVVQAEGLVLAPGFIDLQINGGFGKDFTDTPGCLYEVAAQLPQFGVTAFLPTVITSPYAQTQEALEVWHEGPPPGFQGAIPLGYHLEGPMLNPQKKGAHNPAYMRPPGMDLARGWNPQAGVRLVTLAPELPGASAVIAGLRQAGVVVSAGHTLATFGQAEQAFKEGITMGTHIFNAMPALDHRAPAITGALLQHSEVSVGIIVDGVHVHPAMVDLTWKAKAAGGLVLVTDAMAALGMPAGSYRLGNYDVIVDERVAHLPDGTLAGSILTMQTAVRNLMDFTGCSLAQAVACASSNPARVLSLSHKGRLAQGMDADLVLLTPAGEVLATLVMGQVVYSKTPYLRRQNDPDL